MNDLSPSPLRLTLSTIVQRALSVMEQADDTEAAHAALSGLLDTVCTAPLAEDRHFVQASAALGLAPWDQVILWLMIELEVSGDLATRMASFATGEDPTRPRLDFLVRLSRLLGGSGDARAMLRGALFENGLIRPIPGRLPLVLAPLAICDCVLAALNLPSSVRFDPVGTGHLRCPESYTQAAAEMVHTLAARQVCVALRGGAKGDQGMMAQALGGALGLEAVLIPEGLRDDPALGAALTLGRKLAVEDISGAPGSRTKLAHLAQYKGPRVVLSGADGGLDVSGYDVIDTQLPDISNAEGRAIWQDVLAGADTDCTCPPGLGPSTLNAIGARMAMSAPEHRRYRVAAGAESRSTIEPHGQLVAAHVTDDALVVSDRLRGEFALLLERCRQRRDIRQDLGPAFHARGTDAGVRALLCGTSGGGKTLACSWLATQLDMPLFKVDLASVVSKYIGETEENLARVLDRAEAADVMLLFDEADALFGSRTETKDSSDRFANNQTNYLLTRIENHNGIVLLTTNARQRIDGAFARRIDQVIDMPSPDARQRRTLWQAHLGRAAQITPAELMRLANAADVSGGHIRAIVSTAAVLARSDHRQINFSDLCRALEAHFKGIGRTPPSGLGTGM
ncbi:MAG: ATP-binding protein [Sulfitobacter sp.]